MDTRHSLTNALDGPQFPTNTAPAIADGDRLESADFATILKSMLVNVSQTQQHATRMAESFELGQHQDLASVMVDQQKSQIGLSNDLAGS